MSRSDWKLHTYASLRALVSLHGLLRLCLLPCSVYAMWQGISHKESIDFMTFIESMYQETLSGRIGQLPKWPILTQ
jgi:hypothetical protein